MRHTSASTGTLISLLASVAFMWLIVLPSNLDDVTSLGLKAIALLAAIGVANFAVGRFLNFLSISHLGVGRATPILAASPLFSLILAVIFIGEDVGLATLLGTFLILAGVYVTITAPARGSEVRARGD